VKFTQNSDEGI